ncbi:chemotaxis protein CheA [Silvanigrella aquatica]|uniref:histidine kinase n=1 Tax=Silvanigrella aquatica TaxID=1915309 RepID=A0A1L4D1D7_9BACT|nr:ATP-binding protein [Silvanigrella aquatica]APJ04000.1 hypothetical protein AXG55_08810 [Silvanigrella aquatica]
MEFNEELLQIFKEESADLIERSRDKLENFFTSQNKVEYFQDILRVIHTIKGNAGTIGYNELKKYAHDLETSLLEFKNHEELIGSNVTDRLNKFFDHVESLVNGEIQETPQIETEISHAEFGFFDKNDSSDSTESTPVLSPSQIMNSNDNSNKSNEIKDKKESKIEKSSSDFIRVPTEKIQKNFDIISEIFLIRNQMRYLVEKKYNDNLNSDVFFQDWEILDNSLRKGIGELESIVMSMRMTPIKSLLRRMEKTVRSYLDVNTDKSIIVNIEGEDVEIDKKIIDSLAEPLIHLTRNAMDHGIESIEERKILGKNPQAVIKFSISIIANEAILIVSDDGRGIDENKVMQSAIKKGLNVSNVTTKEEMINLIFLPGFSTVEIVSDVSGRGIGMEAVKTYVESIGGSISIKTEIHKGTQFILRLPLGMSVVPVIIAKSNEHKFAILNSEVLELKKISPSEIVKNGDENYYKRGHEFIPCFNIENSLFSYLKNVSYITDKKEKLSICIIGQSGKLIAIQIGEFVENAEIVIKEYPANAPKFQYVSGISILATGEPTFVISLNKYCESIAKMPNLKFGDA